MDTPVASREGRSIWGVPASVPGCPTVDELLIAMAPHRELVLTDPGESVTIVQLLGAEVQRPHPQPQGARAVGEEPVQGGLEQAASSAGPLMILQQIQPLDLAVVGLSLRVGQIAGTRERVADRLWPVLCQPDPAVRIRQQGGIGLMAVGRCEECGEVDRIVEVPEGLSEGDRRQLGQRGHVVRTGLPDGDGGGAHPHHSTERSAPCWHGSSCGPDASAARVIDAVAAMGPMGWKRP